MLKKILISFLILFSVGSVSSVHAAKNAGIFYSTLYGKEVGCNRLEDFGADASDFFLKDVNDDGLDDAVIYYDSGVFLGQWYVALSDGTFFGQYTKWLDDTSATAEMIPMMGDINGDGRQDAVLFDPTVGGWRAAFSDGVDGFDLPVQFSSGNGYGSTDQFLADMDGDGKDDAVIAWKDWEGGKWYVGLSNGSNSFGGFSPWIIGFGSGSDQRLMGDVNGDGKNDAIIFVKSTGSWNVALSDGSSLVDDGQWKTGFGDDAITSFVKDIDSDGYADIVYYMEWSPRPGKGWAEWFVCYSTGSEFQSNYNHRWLVDWRNIGTKGNPAATSARLLGNMKGSAVAACIVADGTWYCLEYTQRNQTVNGSHADTWSAWDNDYIPQIPGFEGTYDSGDPVINDKQIEMMHDAGFTYIMFDITNGYSNWVDPRAQAFIDRVHHWNNNLSPGQHKMYVTIALGRTRQISDYDAYFAKLELEAKRCWDDWYGPHSDIWYHLNGKPLLIHMQDNSNGNLYTQLPDFTGNRWHIDKFSNRWMQIPEANSYGWIVPKDNLYHPEMMAAMPGFYNGGTFIDRQDGDYYRNHWRRIIQYQPDSVFVESFNENWEHVSIEPAYMFKDVPDHPGIKMWADSYGDRMDDYYWVMTRQYMKLYMDDTLFEGTYVQEYISEGYYGPTYKSSPDGFIKQNQPPHQAPILLMPAGFMSSFSGTVIPSGDPSKPVAWWTFDEGAGMTVTDIENGYAAAMVNMSESAWGEQFLASCLTFDGIDDSVELPAISGEHFTISFWMKTSDTGYPGGHWWNGKGLVDADVSGTAADFGITLMGSNVAFGVGGPDKTIRSITSVNDNTWHHVAVTRNASSGVMMLYIDGSLERTATGAAGARMAAANIRVGAIQTLAASQFYGGLIDDLRFYSTILDETRIAELADSCAVVRDVYGTVAGDWSGTNELPDCTIDLYDIDFLSRKWLTGGIIDAGFEAENAEQISGPLVRSSISGYSGTGYLVFIVSPSGESVSWDVQLDNDADYDLVFRYINGSGSGRPMDLYIDDVYAAVVEFDSLGSWDNWTVQTFGVNLTAGMHNIKLESTGSYGPYLDSMNVSWDSGPIVSMETLKVIAENWLICYDPLDIGCLWPF